MDTEIGAELNKTRDDPKSSSEFRFANEKPGPLFSSRETQSHYMLTVYLKGYSKESIDISMNEDGTQIAVSGEKSTKERFITGWVIYKRESEPKSFRKAFYIPDRVILDRIKARYDDQESVLKIVMPKRVKGIYGDGVKEVEEIKPNLVTSEPAPSEEKEEKPKEEIPPPQPPPPPAEPEQEKPSPGNPLFAAGSTLLISIILFILNHIRERKK